MATPADVLQELLARVRKQLFDRGLVSCGTVLRACKRADWNGNGKLNKKEFEECLKLCASAQDVSALFRAFDITGDGNVTYDEFLTALKVRIGFELPCIPTKTRGITK
jgi:Ca2+-binding EF-hand superfamily protein